MKMKKEKPILQILANRAGVYEVGVRALATDYERAERLSSAIRPAIAIIDKAIRDVYAEIQNQATGTERRAHVE
jgi:hypothetical protein